MKIGWGTARGDVLLRCSVGRAWIWIAGVAAPLYLQGFGSWAASLA
ncbi:hypothetical protein [Methanofollis formosanus]|nr:hypothetical protein [Methanofollis formosanus]